jgi:hypothetical protein
LWGRVLGKARLAVADVGQEDQQEATDESDERAPIDPRRAPQRDGRDAEQQHHVSGGIAEDEYGLQQIRVERLQCRAEDRLPDDHATTDHDDGRVDDQPAPFPTAGSDRGEAQQGEDDDRVVGRVGDIGHRREGDLPEPELEPRIEHIAQAVDGHRDADHRPGHGGATRAGIPGRQEDERGGSEVEERRQEIGDGQLGRRFAIAGKQPQGGEEPRSGDQAEEDRGEPRVSRRSAADEVSCAFEAVGDTPLWIRAGQISRAKTRPGQGVIDRRGRDAHPGYGAFPQRVA